MPTPLVRLQEDLVAVEQRLVLVDAARHLLAERAQLLLEAERDVLDHAADLEVARVHPLAGRHLEQVEDRVALAEAVPEHRDRAEVERRGPEPDEVRVDPVELEVDHPQVLGARRDLELEQLLDAAAEGLHLEEVGEVVHPLDERDHLPVGLVLAGLLDPGVDVAHHRLQVADDLALELDHQPQHAVGRRVVRAHVDRQQLARARVAAASVGSSATPGSWRVAVSRLVRCRSGSSAVAHSYHRGVSGSLLVNSTGSPPTGKSRRCGQPT